MAEASEPDELEEDDPVELEEADWDDDDPEVSVRAEFLPDPDLLDDPDCCEDE